MEQSQIGCISCRPVITEHQNIYNFICLNSNFPEASHEVGDVGVVNGGREQPVVADWGGAEGALPCVAEAAHRIASRAHVNGT